MVMRHVAVIGHPIGQSKSPALHTRWINAHGVEADYTAIDGKDEDSFRELIRTLPEKGYAGVNVTIPFKQLAFELCDELTERAESVGAANLLVFRDGKVIGDNTDIAGFRAALSSMALDPAPCSARIIGAGGAAPAIIVALKEAGLERIEITNRTASKATELAERFEIKPIGWAARDTKLGEIDLLINTTSLGMEGQPPLDMFVGSLPPHAAVIDIITTPRETDLLIGARERGQKTMNGLPMLVHQAVPSFEAWFGIRPDDESAAIEFLEGLK
jgi:shikimate dehydrogenase